MLTSVRLSIGTIALTACAWSAPGPGFVDASREELLKAAPELSALQFDSDQSTLDPLLRTAGARLESMLANFISVSFAEDVHEMRFDNAPKTWTDHRDRFRYVVQVRPFAEIRRQATGDEAQPNAPSAFLISGGFMAILGDLLLENQSQSRFRYLGVLAEGGQRSLVVAFAAKDESRQGLVWLDEATGRVLRWRTDFLRPPPGQELDNFSRDVRFTTVKFSNVETPLWLPTSATVDARFVGGELHTVHRFSDYRVDGSEKDTGDPQGPAAWDEDAKEALLRRPAAPKPTEPASEAIIRVNVRQVLVPVVVTDKEGHHVTGLTQADFRISEDGVEQKITAFSSERADIGSPAVPGAEPGAKGPPTVGRKPLATRHTFVICVDTMHASFANFVHVREALQKLFQQEQAGDSHYAVIALGQNLEVIQDATSDPSRILETLGAGKFRKTFLQGQRGSLQSEASSYERDLRDVRELCDAGDISCPSRKQGLRSQANSLAEQERLSIAQFLRELRAVVDQLARDGGRRTLVLISDGFSLTPGETSYPLLEAYFPEFRSSRPVERMQDAIEPVFRIAAKANVTIDTIDSRGLYTSPAMDASRSISGSVAPQMDRALNDIATDSGMTLSEIAAATGGTAYRNSNDLFAGLQRAFADGREYYMLAYVPTNEAQDGKFRKIDVTVRNSRAVVSAKRGYWAPSP